MNLDPSRSSRRRGQTGQWKAILTEYQLDYNRLGGVRHLLSAYDLSKDKLYAHMKKHKTNAEFLAFLKYLRTLYPPSSVIYVILDNFSPHTVPRVLEYAETNDIESSSPRPMLHGSIP